MIPPYQFLQQLSGAGINFYTGVPDSLLKGLITAIHQFEKQNHLIAVNEGAAVGLAAGYHMATGNIPVVYLQNSGLGNLINPLTSLADREVYSIPMLLVIGWRGEPGLKDEPQHMVMGKITPTILHQIHVPFVVLKKGDDHEWRESLNDAITLCQREQRPVALLVESGVFREDEALADTRYSLSAGEAVQTIYDGLVESDVVVCTTGKIGRIFYQVNSSQKKISKYFLNVGAMGHAVSVATGLARYTDSRVVLLDGDGALLMHMGALALPPSLQLSNLTYVLLNNGAHQSVGSQPTLGFAVDFCTIARGCGFRNVQLVEQKEQLCAIAPRLGETDFLEIRINTKNPDALPRPEGAPKAAKEKFMQALKNR